MYFRYVEVDSDNLYVLKCNPVINKQDRTFLTMLSTRDALSKLPDVIEEGTLIDGTQGSSNGIVVPAPGLRFVYAKLNPMFSEEAHQRFTDPASDTYALIAEILFVEVLAFYTLQTTTQLPPSAKSAVENAPVKLPTYRGHIFSKTPPDISAVSFIGGGFVASYMGGQGVYCDPLLYWVLTLLPNEIDTEEHPYTRPGKDVLVSGGVFVSSGGTVLQDLLPFLHLPHETPPEYGFVVATYDRQIVEQNNQTLYNGYGYYMQLSTLTNGWHNVGGWQVYCGKGVASNYPWYGPGYITEGYNLAYHSWSDDDLHWPIYTRDKDAGRGERTQRHGRRAVVTWMLRDLLTNFKPYVITAIGITDDEGNTLTDNQGEIIYE